jgi:hypothetical protein
MKYFSEIIDLDMRFVTFDLMTDGELFIVHYSLFIKMTMNAFDNTNI